MAGSVELNWLVSLVNKRYKGQTLETGETFLGVWTSGRRLLWQFSDDLCFRNHLGPAGYWIWNVVDPVNVVRTFRWSNGEILYQIDPTPGFAGSWQRTTFEDGYAWLQDQGNDVLQLALRNDDGSDWINEMFSHLRMQIVNYLVDQKYSAGMNNYLRCEALYVAGIAPQRMISTLSFTEAQTLWAAVKERVLASFRARGYAIRGFLLPDGTRGNYQPLIYDMPNADTYAVGERTIFWDSQKQH